MLAGIPPVMGSMPPPFPADLRSLRFFETIGGWTCGHDVTSGLCRALLASRARVRRIRQARPPSRVHGRCNETVPRLL